MEGRGSHEVCYFLSVSWAPAGLDIHGVGSPGTDPVVHTRVYVCVSVSVCLSVCLSLSEAKLSL